MENRYIDERMAELQNEIEQQKLDRELYKKQKRNDISKGYLWIEGMKKEVEKRVIRDTFAITMFKDFEEMKQEYVPIKYPFLTSEDDYIIFTNEETTVNLVFGFSDLQLKIEESSAIRDYILEFLKKRNPTIDIKKVGIFKTPLHIAYFSYVLPGIDRPLFHLAFFFSAHGRFVRGNWNCYKEEQNIWEIAMKRITASIKSWQQ